MRNFRSNKSVSGSNYGIYYKPRPFSLTGGFHGFSESGLDSWRISISGFRFSNFRKCNGLGYFTFSKSGKRL